MLWFLVMLLAHEVGHAAAGYLLNIPPAALILGAGPILYDRPGLRIRLVPIRLAVGFRRADWRIAFAGPLCALLFALVAVQMGAPVYLPILSMLELLPIRGADGWYIYQAGKVNQA